VLEQLRSTGSNPLSAAAAPLLALMTQLRSLPTHDDVDGLHRQVTAAIQDFEKKANDAQVAPEHVLSARYALCSALDETVLSTPWGSHSMWGTKTLLSTFHKETWGGEKFFTILDRILQEPSRNIDLLELLYLCLALGFEGKYKIQERGQSQLAGIQDDVYRAIRRVRGDFERRLSPNWQGLQDRRNVLTRFVPLWVVASVLATLVLGMFLYFRFSLATISEPIELRLSQIGSFELPVASAPNVAKIRLRPLLSAPESRGELEIFEEGTVTVITVKGDNLFASGRAVVSEAYQPLLATIGDALSQVPGVVRVIGHTDNVPIRSLNFQSNWDLSRERALYVSEVLAQHIQASRLISQGVADTRPIAGNETPEGRARNRRIEIIHLAEGTVQ
jgi:type VI secretion system protein ImpK